MASRKSTNSTTQTTTPKSPYELILLHDWFASVFHSVQHASQHIDAYQPQTPEGVALQGIYHDILALCDAAIREAADAHLPEEIAALLAFQRQELEYMLARRQGQRQTVAV